MTPEAMICEDCGREWRSLAILSPEDRRCLVCQGELRATEVSDDELVLKRPPVTS